MTATNAGTHFFGYDGNGNVALLAGASNGTASANYEYDPFGNLLRITERLGVVNPFRFSTKHTDAESGFSYFGFRFYSGVSGGWLSRDPIEEEGGLNVYGFVQNAPSLTIDVLGLVPPMDLPRHPLPRKPGREVVTIPKLHPELPNPHKGNHAEERMRKGAVENSDEYGYEVISVEDVTDANGKLTKLSAKCCIETLNIEGHGANASGQFVGSANGESPDRAFWVRRKPRTKEFEYVNVDLMFKNINFCKPCKIWLRGCGVASDEDLYPLLKSKIESITGCTVFAYANDCRPGRRGLYEPPWYARCQDASSA